MEWSFRKWFEAACFGGGIWGTDLQPVTNLLFQPGDRVRIARAELMKAHGYDTRRAGQLGKIDRAVEGAMSRVVFSDGKHEYLPWTLLQHTGPKSSS